MTLDTHTAPHIICETEERFPGTYSLPILKYGETKSNLDSGQLLKCSYSNLTFIQCPLKIKRFISVYPLPKPRDSSSSWEYLNITVTEQTQTMRNYRISVRG